MAVPRPKIVRVSIPSSKYRKGRWGKITQISEHHVVGDSKSVIAKARSDAVFSCTFTIDLNGTIYQLVEIGDTPFTDNDLYSNSRSITIEHAGGGNFPYTPKMYASSIHLHAYLFDKYGPLTCVRHRDIPEIKADPERATACSGDLDVERIVKQAKELHGGLIVYKGKKTHEWYERAKWLEISRDKYLGLSNNQAKQLATLRKRADELSKRPTQESFDQLRLEITACEQVLKDGLAAPEPDQASIKKANWLVKLLAKLFAKK